MSSGGGSDDPTEEPTPTSGSEEEEEYVVVMDQTQIVKKKDYSLSEGVQVGDIFTIKGIYYLSCRQCYHITGTIIVKWGYRTTAIRIDFDNQFNRLFQFDSSSITQALRFRPQQRNGSLTCSATTISFSISSFREARISTG